MSGPNSEAAASGGKSKTKLILIGTLAALLLVGGAVGVTLMLVGGGPADAAVAEGAEAAETEEAENPAPAIYVPLEPAFVVNFQDEKKRTKFLKAEISVVTDDPEAEAAITQHMPAVRNNLVMLLSRQVFEELSSNEGKEKLRSEALVEVQQVMEKQAGRKTGAAVKDLFFSSLVMQ